MHEGVQAQPHPVHALRTRLAAPRYQQGVDDALGPLHRALRAVLLQQSRAAVHERRCWVPVCRSLRLRMIVRGCCQAVLFQSSSWCLCFDNTENFMGMLTLGS